MQARYRLTWRQAHRRAAIALLEAIAIGVAVGATSRLLHVVSGWPL